MWHADGCVPRRHSSHTHSLNGSPVGAAATNTAGGAATNGVTPIEQIYNHVVQIGREQDKENPAWEALWLAGFDFECYISFSADPQVLFEVTMIGQDVYMTLESGVTTTNDAFEFASNRNQLG